MVWNGFIWVRSGLLWIYHTIPTISVHFYLIRFHSLFPLHKIIIDKALKCLVLFRLRFFWCKILIHNILLGSHLCTHWLQQCDKDPQLGPRPVCKYINPISRDFSGANTHLLEILTNALPFCSIFFIVVIFHFFISFSVRRWFSKKNKTKRKD